jgi:hypothetical protein
MSFGGLTPRGPYRVAVDWTLAYDYYEDLINAGATASTFGFFGGLTSQKLFHDLQKARVIQVHAADGSDASPEDFYKFIDPLLARINSELLRDAAPPGTVDASGFHQATQRGRFLGGDYRVALRARTDVRSGAGQVDFTVRTRQEAHARADGLLGVAPYLKRMRESDLVSTVEAGEWDDAYLMLPAILRRQSFGVLSATLAVRFAAGDETLGSSVFSWAPRRGWTDESGEPRGVAHFHFGTARQPRTDLRFETTLSLDTVHGSQQIASSVPAFTGKRAIASLRESFEVIGFDATLAPWQFGDGVSVQRGDLQEIALRVEAGGSVHAATLRTRQVGRATLPPLPVQFLLPRDRGPVRVTATMRRGGRIYRWRHNDAKDVRARLADPSLITLHVSPGEWIDASK